MMIMPTTAPKSCSPATGTRAAPPNPLPSLSASNAAPRLLLLAALALSAAADCSFSTVSRPAPLPRSPHAARPAKQHLLSPFAWPGRAQRSLLRLDAATPAATAARSGAATGAARPVIMDESQLSALVQLNEAWGTWAGNSNAATACAAWAGVTCSPKGLVLALDAKAFVADPPPSGAIPADITNLAYLQYLDLSYIDLVGSIPSLASLTSLTHLAIGMDGCRLAGTLDGLGWLSSLSNLQTLRLVGLADFTGDLSSLHILSHLESIQHLALSSLTNATGEIPREIRYLTALTALDLSYLRAVDFPDWVTQLPNLQSLNVNADDERRQGLLSDDFSLLTALTSLSLGHNNLDGYLPKSWSSLVNLQELDLTYNRLQGTIPATFSTLTALTKLVLSENSLSGSIPPAFSTNIQILWLGYNSFSGPIPPHLALTNLVELQLSSNLFTGGIPSAFTKLTAMSTLDICNNSLSSDLDVVAQMTWLTDI
ncbi:hypothetical protein CLOM_g1951 [Closterium sp. NIES-68]|nr:hypothetical protein CLOM_g1951 [Closterium sp. NIES-68]